MTPEQYQEYLKSNHWRVLSDEIKRARRKCEVCGMKRDDASLKYRQDLNVHHKNYSRLGRELPADLIVLCHRCHMEKHGMETWVDLAETFKMPPVGEPMPIACAICGDQNGPLVHNFDEIKEWICDECAGEIDVA